MEKIETFNHFANLNIWAILVAAVSGFILGAIYYGPLLGKVWQQEVGLSDEEVSSGAAQTFIPSFLMAVVASFTLALFMGDHMGWKNGLLIGLTAGLGIAVTTNTTNQLFEKRPIKLMLINAGYWILNLTIMGIILGAWR